MTAVRKVYAMLGNETLWELTERCAQILGDARIAYSVCGGVAVCLHGYQRNTVDLDLVVREVDSKEIVSLMTDAGLTWNPDAKEFRTESGIALQLLISGQSAGEGR